MPGIKRSAKRVIEGTDEPLRQRLNVHVGQRIQLRRTALGISQTAFAEALDASLEQIQQYENGSSQVPVPRLLDISLALSASLGFIFSDVEDDTIINNINIQRQSDLNRPIRFSEANNGEDLSFQETSSLVRAYYSIKDLAMRRRIMDLIESLSSKTT